MIQTLDTNTMTCGRLSADELNQALRQFIGSECWYRHPINKRMIYTDGVKFFAENAGVSGGYWFLDKVAIEICPLMKEKQQYFVSLVIKVNPDDHSAVIEATDGNETTLATFEICYTDLQPGEWRFYLQDDIEHWVLLLPSEY
jgi:hypothetical protein